MKKTMMLIGALALTFLGGCGNSNKETLNVFNWGEYIDRAVLDMFEEEFNVTINYDTFDSNETMYQRLRAGTTSYDVVIPSDYKIERMISEGMLQQLNFDKIPNMQYVDPEFKGLVFDPDNLYSVPYFWGTVGIVYDSTVVAEPVDSWEILWNENYRDQVYMYDSQRDSLMVALKLLGYSINTRDINELEAAKNKLIDQQEATRPVYVTDTVINSMIAGNAALAVVYSGDAAFIMSENPNMNFALPKEGTNFWVDAMVIPADAPNPDLAHEFINFMMRPDIAQMNTEFVMYSTPNMKALEAVKNEPWAQNIAYNPPKELLYSLDLEMYRDPGDFLAEFDRIWTKVLAGSR